MAETQAYRITSARDPFDGTTQVLVEGSYGAEDAKYVQVGGDPVELSESQVEQIKARFNVRKASEDAEVSSGEIDASSLPKGEGGAVSVERAGKGDTGSEAGGASSTPGAKAR